jgi:ElaB/YqjD/DUF883 family membrane-anchored ribosome-binding protein
MADETTGTFPSDAPKKGARGKASPSDDRLVAEPPLKDTGAQGFGETPRSATQQFKDEADRLTKQATDRARSFADDGKARATGALDEFSKMMREAADTVDERLGDQYGKYARSAADSISDFAESLRGKDVDELVGDARDFVRKSPAIALGTAAAVGFVLARLVKSGIDAAADLADRYDDENRYA